MITRRRTSRSLSIGPSIREWSLADAHDEEFQPKVYDGLTGHELDKNEVLKARLNEIEVFVSMGVWDVAPR